MFSIFFTATPERRAELLAKVRARDKAFAETKAKGPTVTIVKDGQPAASIVGGSDSKQAKEILQEWIRLMTGATLPFADKPADGQVGIYVGQAAQDGLGIGLGRQAGAEVGENGEGGAQRAFFDSASAPRASAAQGESGCSSRIFWYAARASTG